MLDSRDHPQGDRAEEVPNVRGQGHRGEEGHKSDDRLSDHGRQHHVHGRGDDHPRCAILRLAGLRCMDHVG